MEWNKEHKNENRQERGKLCLQRMEAEEVVHVYENYMRRDFPKNELKPLSAIQRMLDEGMYDCLGLYEDNRLMAYGFFVTDKKRGVFLLDYLAVSELCRGMGYGGKCLERIREFYKREKGILLECESLESAQSEEEKLLRERRIRVYLENGCVRTKLRSLLFGVEYEILYMPLTEETADGAKELENLYRKIMPGDWYEKYMGGIWRE